VIPPTDDLAAIPSEPKTKRGKVQKFVFRQSNLPASPLAVIRPPLPSFRALVLLLFGFLIVGLQMWVAFSLSGNDRLGS
jgi:hypothetical protein